ncbi:MAG: C-GCAxxG-C-C family protein [Candidatus Firestonebacteria bacterium]
MAVNETAKKLWSGEKTQTIARKLYLEGYSCTESMLHSFKNANVVEISDEVLKVGAGFRTGIVGSGCLCGVLTASVIIIGLKYGRKDKNENNKIADEKIKKFYEEFKNKYKATCCRVITKKWKENFSSQDRKNHCANIVSEMSVILEKLL